MSIAFYDAFWVEIDIVHSIFAVGIAPKVVAELQDQVVTAQTDVTLKCDISPGDPVASTTWYKDNKELRAGRKLIMSYLDDVASLVVKDVSLTDAGSYSCEAVNKIGRVQTDGKLTVHGTIIRSISIHCSRVVACRL